MGESSFPSGPVASYIIQGILDMEISQHSHIIKLPPYQLTWDAKTPTIPVCVRFRTEAPLVKLESRIKEEEQDPPVPFVFLPRRRVPIPLLMSNPPPPTPRTPLPALESTNEWWDT
jgi:hypothetical protein